MHMPAFRACVVLATAVCAVQGFSPAAIQECAKGTSESFCSIHSSTIEGLECVWSTTSSECVVQAERRCPEWDDAVCEFKKEIETGGSCVWDAVRTACFLPTLPPATPAPATNTPPAPIDLNKAADDLATAAIIGIVIGCVALIVIVALIVWCVVRSSNNKSAARQQEMQPTPAGQGQEPV